MGRWPSQPPRSPKTERIHEVSHFNDRIPGILQRIAARGFAQPSFLSHSLAVQESKGSWYPRDYIVTPRDNISSPLESMLVSDAAANAPKLPNVVEVRRSAAAARIDEGPNTFFLRSERSLVAKSSH